MTGSESGSLYLPVQNRNRELTSQLLYSYRVSAPARFFLSYSMQVSGRQSGQPLPHQPHFREIHYAWQP